MHAKYVLFLRGRRSLVWDSGDIHDKWHDHVMPWERSCDVSVAKTCTIPESHNAPFCNRNVHTFLLQNGVLWDICKMSCGIWQMGHQLDPGTNFVAHFMQENAFENVCNMWCVYIYMYVYVYIYIMYLYIPGPNLLTDLPLDKMAAISQTTFSNALF